MVHRQRWRRTPQSSGARSRRLQQRPTAARSDEAPAASLVWLNRVAEADLIGAEALFGVDVMLLLALALQVG